MGGFIWVSVFEVREGVCDYLGECVLGSYMGSVKILWGKRFCVFEVSKFKRKR